MAHAKKISCFFLLSLFLAACAQRDERHAAEEEIGRSASDLPPPIMRKRSETVIVELTTKEVVAELAPGVTYEYWTYNGTVPGPFLRVREGDTVEIRLTHSAEEHDSVSALPRAEAHEEGEEGEDDVHMTGENGAHAAAGHGKHSIDLHAVIGPGGGASLTQTEDGKTSIFRFKANHPGIYVYHCASPHIPTHVANGMYGMILVEPKEGLPPADREFAVMQGEFYTQGALGEKGRQAFSKEKLLQERPEYVVFNGRVGSLREKRALRAKTGENIRLFFGVGSHIASNVHLIGGVFDRLYGEGALLSEPQRNVQTTIVPPGGAMMAEWTLDVPGTYLLVDHSLARAIDRGAIAELVIEGDPRPDLYRAANPDPNHTHADLAMWMDGRQIDFSDEKYMLNEGSNDLDKETNPHLHGGNGLVVHRHKPGQSIGDFPQAIAVTSTARCVTLHDAAPVCNQGGKRWRMFVNGGERPFDPSYVFADLDRILLTYGATDEDAERQLAAMSDDACLFSRTCPERGKPPPENCVADPAVPCTE